jgi:hypothetical protein
MRDDLEIPFFPHRLNQDGSYDSICLRCCSTIATARLASELDEFDLAHTCGAAHRGFLHRIRAMADNWAR